MKTRLIGAVNQKQCTDTGLALVLISIASGLITEKEFLYVIALVLVVINMTIPRFFYHPARLWFGFSRVLGILTSGVLLGIVFFVVVCPVALIRRISGKDRLGLKGFRKGRASVFVVRNHTYVAEDLLHPY